MVTGGGQCEFWEGAPRTLEATRVRDANAAEPSNAVIRSVQFHANGSLLLTAGLDKSLRLFEVDGASNRKVQGIFFDDLPIHKACFSGDGAKVIVAGEREKILLFARSRRRNC